MKSTMRRFAMLFLVSAAVLGVLWANSSEKTRVVTEEELAGKTGEDNGEIWMSIIGQVYNVTSGRDYYGGGPVGYGIFAGRDASVAFVTGEFTEDEAKKSTDTLSDSHLKSLEHWSKFYDTHENYTLVGVLEGRFYDKDGNPTEELTRLRKRIADQEKKKKNRRGEERTGPPVRCDIQDLDKCSQRAEKYAMKWMARPTTEVTVELTRLEAMTTATMTENLSKWVRERIMILQQIAKRDEKSFSLGFDL